MHSHSLPFVLSCPLKKGGDVVATMIRLEGARRATPRSGRTIALLRLIIGTALFLTWSGALTGQVLVYDRATFASHPSTGLLSGIDFDSTALGTNLAGQTILGATFTAPGSIPLEVITGTSGVRFPLAPSSGLNVLSPGGNNPAQEEDDLEITFVSPVQAAGLDVVFDVPDGAAYVSVSFYDDAGALLGQNTFIPSPNGAPGYQFVGFIADVGPWIKRIVIDDYDGSASDDNIAFDSVVFSYAVPEPAAGGLLALGLAATGWVLRRRA